MFVGSAFWRCIHYFAQHDIGCSNFLPMIKAVLPEEYKVDWEDPSDQEDLVMWSIRLHNKINQKTGKYAGWDTTDFSISHKPECDYLTNREFVFFFPWGFIHSVAGVMDPVALDVLKSFNQLYPDSQMRGTFFTDEPGDEETVYDWTIRHHKRINLLHGRDEMEYVPVVSDKNTELVTPCDSC